MAHSSLWIEPGMHKWQFVREFAWVEQTHRQGSIYGGCTGFREEPPLTPPLDWRVQGRGSAPTGGLGG